MNNPKHHIRLLMVAVIAIVSVSFLVLNSIKILAETLDMNSSDTTTSTSTTTTPPSCTYDCSSWSACSSSGTQTRTCKKSPDSCYDETASPSTSQSCAYVPPACTYTYSDWSSCSSSGIQTRNITSKSPSGCVEGNTESLSRSCTYIPPAEIQPAPPLCSYTYTEWNECLNAGMQYRDIKSYSPEGCVGGTVEELKRSCTYGSDQNSSTDSTGASDNTIQTGGSTNTEVNSSGGTGTSNTSANTTADQPSQPANTITGTQTNPPADISWSVNDDWKKKYFGSNTCPETSCGGNADPDKDRLSNNDEVRYGTDPLNPDTDGDGKLDGDEVASGSNPLKYSKIEGEDKIIFESPKEAGEIKADVYKVENVKLVDFGEGKKVLKVSGKGPGNSFVTVYIYSGQPIIVTVKTDSNGDWTYTIDKELAEGNHEVYVAVTNNSGAIKAKSEPLPFVKTAQAVTTTRTAEANTVQSTARTGISAKNLLFILAFSFFGVVVAFILIGLAIKKIATKTKQ